MRPTSSRHGIASEAHGWVAPLPRAGGVKYGAQERAWVMRLLARLTPAQRARYEDACEHAGRHEHSGKLYDGEKARIAERILYEDARALSRPEVADGR